MLLEGVKVKKVTFRLCVVPPDPSMRLKNYGIKTFNGIKNLNGVHMRKMKD